MDKKGRIFGKISIIDICALLVIIGLFLGAYYKVFMLDSKHLTAKYYDTIEYEVLLKDKQSIEGIEIKTKVYDVKTNSYMGKIIDKKVMHATSLVTKADGAMVIAEKPERYDILLTISVPGIETTYGFLANGNIDLNMESFRVLKTQTAIVEAKIVNVRNVSRQ
ncbi:DUF4330 domain-containing protein [Lutispora sp.]|uniref:DUF4330 domain-containing protein n=1 Tax=Lutispora sp. TaxID=2828727 RepID=UPI003568B010